MPTVAKEKTLLGDLARTEESVSRFVPYTRHVDETTIKTKEGYLLKVIRLEGMPFETADQPRSCADSRTAVSRFIITSSGAKTMVVSTAFLRMTGAENSIMCIRTSSPPSACSSISSI